MYRNYDDHLSEMNQYPTITHLTDSKEEVFKVGSQGVKEILEHKAQGEGDRWYYDVIYENNKCYRCFDPKGVLMIPTTPEPSEYPF